MLLIVSIIITIIISFIISFQSLGLPKYATGKRKPMNEK